jgi:glycine/D-amino acid oxidase-like deaminating enzyme
MGMTERISPDVSRLPRDPGLSGWNALLETPPLPRVLDEAITADWLIIGAGFAGLAAARRLAQLHQADRIVVLDAVRIGTGPSGRNAGFMIDLPHDISSDGYGGGLERDKRQIAMNRTAIAFAADAVREYELPGEAFQAVGKMNAAVTDKGLANNTSFAAHLTALGEDHTLLDADEMRRITGTAFYRGGLHAPGTVMIQPAIFVRGIARGLEPVVDLYESTPVTRLEQKGPDWCATTPSGSVTAPHVILSVNGHANSFGFYPNRLMHIFTYASLTRALSADEVRTLGGEPHWAATPADPQGTTVRRVSGVGGDRILIRNRFTYDPSMEVGQARMDRVARGHDRSFAARFPMLDGVTMEHRWGGRLCLSRNGVPAFGELEPGLFSACCQNGVGIAKGTLSGMLAADLAAGGNDPMVADMLAFDEPERLPREPIASLGANALLAWKSWRAGVEF